MDGRNVRACIFIYNSFALFEVAPAAFLLSQGGAALLIVAESTDPVPSIEGLRIQPDTTLLSVDPLDFSALIIPALLFCVDFFSGIRSSFGNPLGL